MSSYYKLKNLCPNSRIHHFEYHIVPCYNLYQQLLWYRERLEILEPISMREEIKCIIKKMSGMYEKA